MRLQQIAEQIQEVTPHHYLVKLGDIYRVMQHNYNGVELSDEVLVSKVTRMSRGSVSGRVISHVSPSKTMVKMSDGYEPASAQSAYEIYQLQHGVMKHLAADASESPNYIRQINDIDS